MKQLVEANIKYLQNAIEFLKSSRKDETEYRLARKEVFISTANIQGAYQRMKSEPSKVRFNLQVLNEFILLNHSLSSFIAGLNTSKSPAGSVSINQLYHAVQTLQDGIKSIDNSNLIPDNKMNEEQIPDLPNGVSTLDETANKINEIIKKL
jgi:hypothetical protein